MSVVEISVLFMVTVALFLMGMLSQINEKRALQRTIDRQQDTIQRLINREPVTYEEVGKKPEKVIEETYSAWGNVTVDREVESRE